MKRESAKAITVTPVAPPGVRFIYSDINFNLLAEIVRRVSGRAVAKFAQRSDLSAAAHER